MAIRRSLGLGTALAAVCAVMTVSTTPLDAKSSSSDLVVRSSRTQFDLNDRIDWTIDWTKSESGTSEEQVEVDLKGQHEFIDGSVEAPPGWTVEYSDDEGETYTKEPGGYVSRLRFSHDEVSPDIVNVSIRLPRPIPPVATAAGGGDGYIPMLAGDRIFAVWHHLKANRAKIVCVDTFTGAMCPGYPKPLGMQTSLNPGLGVYVKKKLFMKNRDATTHGVLCWDTEENESCGYTPIANLGPSPHPYWGVDGGFDRFSSPIYYEKKIYFAGHDHYMYCFDPASQKICDGYTREGKPMALAGEPANNLPLLNDVILHDGRVYFSLPSVLDARPVPLGTRVECFDLETQEPCADFGTNGVVTEASGQLYIYHRYDTTGNPIGFCMTVRNDWWGSPIDANVPCYDYSGKTRTTIPSSVPLTQFEVAEPEEATIGTRTFFGRFPYRGGYCYDWSTGAPCTGTYFDSKTGQALQGTAEQFYGFVARGQCMVGLGDKGILTSIDPLSGASPCMTVEDSAVVKSAKARYCRDTRYLDGWSDVHATNVEPGDFSRFDVSVTDGKNNVTGSLLGGPVSLSRLDSTGSLSINATAVVDPNKSPWNSATPTVQLALQGSHQFCFQTVAKPMPTTVTEAVIEVITDEGTKEEGVAPDPVLLSSGALEARLPATGSDSTPLSLFALGLLAVGTAMLVTGRRRVPRT